MKVLQINSVYGYGSTGGIVVGLADEITEESGQCLICFGRGDVSIKSIDANNIINVANKFENTMHCIYTRVFDAHGFHSKQSTMKLISTIKTFNPDIIHLHNLHGYYINIEIFFSFLKSYNKPVIWTLHDCWPLTGHCAYFEFIKCEKWKKGCYKCQQRNRYPRSWIFDRSRNNYLRKEKAFNGVDNLTIVTPSKWLSEIVNVSYLNKYSVEIICNGIDLDVFRPKATTIRKKYNLEKKNIVLGVASVWDERKGLNDYIELARMLEHSYIIVLVGLSKNQIKRMPENIMGIKRTENIRELAEWYSTADVFLNFSMEESFGLVTAEAMACGTPVVAYDASATPELVGDNCGRVIPCGDIYEAKMAVEEIVKNGRESYMISCRHNAVLNFDKQGMQKKYIQLYNSILRNKDNYSGIL